MSKKQTLPDHVKEFIVSRLACYDTPTQALEAVKAEFADLDLSNLTRQHIETYHPYRVQGEKLSEALRVLFDKTREKYRNDLEEIPHSGKAVRIRMLGTMADRAFDRKNDVLAASHLEQIAKEMGGVYAARAAADTPAVVDDNKPRHPGQETVDEIARRFGRALTVHEGGKDKAATG